MTGNDVIQIRLALNISQSALAKLMNVSVRSVQRWESAKEVPSIAATALVLYLKVLDYEHKRR